jgi:CBS domain-containing protein
MCNSPDEPAPKNLKRVVVEKTGALSPNDSVQTAGDRMRSVQANAWPVAEDRKLVGVIDQPNPDRAAGGKGHDPRTTRVGDTMRHDAVFCYEDQEASEADRLMGEHQLNHLPVVDREMRIVGIISRQDVKDQVEGNAEAGKEGQPDSDWKPGGGSPRPASGKSQARTTETEGEGAARGAEDTDAERLPSRAPADAEAR